VVAVTAVTLTRRRERCGASDGFSVCTEPDGHGGPHYDRSTDHEWDDDDWLGDDL
jgi:hypothetical protein